MEQQIPITCRRILSKQLITKKFQNHDGITVIIERWRWIFFHLAMSRLDATNTIHLDTAVGTYNSLPPLYTHVTSGLAREGQTLCSIGLHEFILPFCIAACYEVVGEFDTPLKPFIQSVYSMSCKHCNWNSEYTLGCFDVNNLSRCNYMTSDSDTNSDIKNEQSQNLLVRHIRKKLDKKEMNKVD